MDNQQQAQFEGWALVEIMGHQRVAGYVTTQAFGSTVMFRVEQQEVAPREEVVTENRYESGVGYLRPGDRIRISRERAETYIGAGSVYRMTRITEAEAMKCQSLKIEVLERAALPELTAGDQEEIDAADALMAESDDVEDL